MAKRRTRGELTRADVKAIERRSAPSSSPAVVEMPAEAANVASTTAAAAPGVKKGVLPPRTSRSLGGGFTLSRAQEMAYVRSDLRRLTILATAMVAILIVLAFIIR